jgi:hypothetical protein
MLLLATRFRCYQHSSYAAVLYAVLCTVLQSDRILHALVSTSDFF